MKGMTKMTRLIVAFLTGAFLLTACTDVSTGSDPNKPQAFKITRFQERKIPKRMLDAVNTFRAAEGLAPLALNDQLAEAARAHSQDMAAQNRPWNWGSDGSSPLDRVARVGYPGVFRGEVISESFEDDLSTVNAWLETPANAAVLLDPDATNMGVGWYQEPSGKIWWTVDTGA